MIEVNYNEYKETIAQNMKLIVENHDLKQEIERLNNITNKAIDYIEYYLAKGKTKNHSKFDISVLEILKGE